MTYLYVVLVLLILYIVFTCNKKEGFATSHENNKHVSFGRRANSGLSLLDDSLFNGVINYPPDDNVYNGGEMGIEKCLNECDGTCIEFGVHSGLCFPKA